MKTEADNILVMENITKEFPGVRALDGVTFAVRRNSVHALVGENGAGKSTLMKILTGHYAEYEGSIILNGNTVKFPNERAALEAGISIVSQELNLVPELTVSENVFLGREITRGALLSKAKQIEQTARLLNDMELSFKATDKISSLSIAQRQLVEILKATSRNAKIVVMDEPTSALTDVEIECLFKQIDILKSRGITIIYISHKLDEIFHVCEEITVMRDGAVVGSVPTQSVSTSQLITMMVGRPINDIYPELPPRGSQLLLQVKNLYRKGEYSDISFTLNKGEIMGIAGMMGSGRSEIAKTIFGLTQQDTGEVLLCGERLRTRQTKDAIDSGIVMVTEDRAMYGFVGAQSIRDNILLANCDRYAKSLIIDRKALAGAAEAICEKLSVKAPNLDMEVGKLSGGNQQKIVLAKWLIRDVKVLILDEPTRGIDVGAKHEIYRLIVELARQGLGILMISSELPEIIGLSHRALVMAQGKIKGEIMRGEITQEKIMQTILSEK